MLIIRALPKQRVEPLAVKTNADGTDGGKTCESNEKQET